MGGGSMTIMLLKVKMKGLCSFQTWKQRNIPDCSTCLHKATIGLKRLMESGAFR